MAGVLGRFALDGRTALVTGAAGGIGFATATALAEAGASVVLADIDEAALTKAGAELGVPTLVLDVTDERAVAESVGDIDVLVNNAGIASRSPSVTYERETWDRILAVNLTGPFLMSQAAARAMIPRGGGAIVNVASAMGFVGNDMYPNPAYHASKGALVNLTRTLAIEWASHGIRVNAVAPCFVETPLTEKLLSDEAMRTAILERTPLGRLARPEEIASAIVFLASDAASMVTGHVLAVDGGWLAR